MLTLHTTDDFASWYGALADEDAEEVAHGIGLIEALGPERVAPGSSDLLLWYQCPESDLTVPRYADLVSEHAIRFRRVLHHLESASVQRRLQELPSKRAQIAYKAIEALIVHTRWRQVHGVDVQVQYRNVLEALGLEEPSEPGANAALRQLDFCKRRPGMRVLYGVDAPRQRALLVLGEVLDRSAYGPSVRRALAAWSRFLHGSLELGALGSTQ